jgi:hypothetical protein
MLHSEITEVKLTINILQDYLNENDIALDFEKLSQGLNKNNFDDNSPSGPD